MMGSAAAQRRIDTTEFAESVPQSARTPILPSHIEGTIAAIARLHTEHRQRATRFQRLTEGLTARAGRPSFMMWLLIVVVGWIAFNLSLMGLGVRPPG